MGTLLDMIAAATPLRILLGAVVAFGGLWLLTHGALKIVIQVLAELEFRSSLKQHKHRI